MYKYLVLIFMIGCTYQGVVVNKGINRSDLEVKINDYYYVMPLITIDEYDNIKLGDTIKIDKVTLRVIR